MNQIRPRLSENEFNQRQLKKFYDKKFYRVLIFSDCHGWLADQSALRCINSVLQSDKFDEVVINGDVVDMTYISRHTSKLYEDGILNGYSEIGEIDYTKEQILKPLRLSTGAEIRIRIGNHDERITNPINISQSQLARLAVLYKHFQTVKFEDMLELKKSEGYVYDPSDVYTYFDMFDVVHGLSLAKNASEKNIQEYMSSGCSGHCFSDDTEILTPNGWVNGLTLKKDDLVATMNKSTKELEWNPVNEVFNYDGYKELYQIKGMAIDLLVTDSHGLIYETVLSKEIKETTAIDMINGSPTTKYNFFNAPNPGKKQDYQISDDELRLIIQIVTDGSFDQNSIRWHLKKERKIQRLVYLLERLGLNYSINRGILTTRIRINVADSKRYISMLGDIKALPEFITKLSKRQSLIVLEEYSLTDGCKNSSAVNSYQISSSKEIELDRLQHLFCANGFRTCKIFNQKRGILTVNIKSMIELMPRNNVKKVPYSGKVWCVNVNNGTLVVRRNGKTAVTLNSHRLNNKFLTNRKKPYVWFESGCTRIIKEVEYFPTGKIADWQQGFIVVNFLDEGDNIRFYAQSHLILEGKTVYNGTLHDGNYKQ